MPWLMLFRAELTKAALRRCVRWALRRADIAQMTMDASNNTTATPPIRITRMVSGSNELTEPDGARVEAAETRAGDATIASRQANAAAGITPLPPACQILPTIEHPRIYPRSVWLHGFESGKCLPQPSEECRSNCSNWPHMINTALAGACP